MNIIIKIFFQMAYNCFNSHCCYDYNVLNTLVRKPLISIRYNKLFPAKKRK